MPPKKDKDKPKGKTSAYAFFSRQKKEEYKAKGISLDFSAFSKACSEDWKKTGLDKSKFVKLAEQDKVRYEREMEDYIPPPDSKDAKRKKKKKDANAPKRALSGFMFFSQDKRPEIKSRNPDLSIGEVAKELGSRWKLLGPADKEPYEKLARDDRERYMEEMAEYKKSGGGQNYKKSPQKRGRKPKAAAVIDDEDDDDEEEEEDEEESSSD